jgi:hypothetical protein
MELEEVRRRDDTILELIIRYEGMEANPLDV